MRDFGMALEDCGLTSLKYKGYKFTWTNNRTGDDRAQLRLDRGWRMLHSVQWARRFMFEEMWTEVDGCTETVVQAWGEIRQIQGQLDGFKKKPQTDDVVRCQRRLAGELDILLAREEMIWQQSGENDFSTVLAAMQPKVTLEHNERLSQLFSRAELEDVLSKMFPTKSHGHDGMPALFYQRYWHVIGNYVDVISEYQSAFVPSRLITDNIIAAFESIHAIQRRRGSALKKMILKLDMSKAYDRVEWNFLSCMMRKLGFNNRWVDLIMDCISTVSFSAQSTKQIRGVAVAQGAPTLSHLFFAYDSLLFCNAHLSDCYNLMLLLRVYKRVSSQKINFVKFAASFSPKTDPIMKCLISSMLGVRIVDCHTRYLGLPTITGRSKHRLFNYVKDMLWNKLHMGNAKLLSMAGKEVLIKAVAQGLPTYTMGSGKRSIHWNCWRNLCRPKCLRGLGFKIFEAFNQAMVAKQAWRLLKNPSSLVGQILRARYFPNGDLLTAGGKVLVSVYCSGCGTATEDVIHAFWGCKRSRQFWALTSFNIDSTVRQGSFADFLEVMFLTLSDCDLERFVCCCWRVRKLRNEVLYRKTVEFLEQFKIHNTYTKPARVPRFIIWIKPPSSSFLLNCDGAIGQAGCSRGVGGALRDSAGNFIWGFVDQGPAGLDVLATEEG
ncbi:PREDICTED: reverse mRNAase [Prunus dulcis]|uniref:PREDICTED: reverse mRNAase n=1 Tax=Prunus dulcis TaxID=3755 RepID=A0A5E4GHG7_PRUDU|nr:PREDICTED: reverse mRNAase [Prunus dulcis]